MQNKGFFWWKLAKEPSEWCPIKAPGRGFSMNDMVRRIGIRRTIVVGVLLEISYFLCNLAFRTFFSENSRERLRVHFELIFLLLLSIWLVLERFYIWSNWVVLEDDFIVCAILFTFNWRRMWETDMKKCVLWSIESDSCALLN